MTDEASLLAAVRANLADDQPRFALADFLEQRGRGDDADRAAYIRVQCRRAACSLYDRCHVNNQRLGPYPVDHCRCLACRECRIESRLWAKNAANWQGPFYACIADLRIEEALARRGRRDRWGLDSAQRLMNSAASVSTFVFRRGFLAEVRTVGHDWRDMGARMVREPLAAIERVSLIPFTPEHDARGTVDGEFTRGWDGWRCSQTPEWDNVPLVERGGDRVQLSRLPRVLFDQLDGMLTFAQQSRFRFYPNAELAQKALSASALDYAWSNEPRPALDRAAIPEVFT
jgi:uncharacterized protein (TIGR02996 family)